jgi:hypothetical protein
VVALALVLAAGAVAVVATQLTTPQRDQRAEVRRVVKTYETAILRGDGTTACAQLTAGAVREMLQRSAGVGQGNSCAAVGRSVKRYVDSLMAQAPSPERAAAARRILDDPQVEVVSVDGDTATARIAGVSNKPIRLAHAGGGWKITSFSFTGG